MRLFLLSLILILISCSDSTKNRTDGGRPDTSSKVKSYLDKQLVDTPKVFRAGKDYVTIATSPHDKIYFGDKFAPYKMEPYDIADIERAIDSLIKSEKFSGNLKNKSLTDFKYQFFSVKTAKQKFQTRVQAICVEQANRRKWNSPRLEMANSSGCYFNFIYDLTDKKVIWFSEQR